jgi:hypothetical protein
MRNSHAGDIVRVDVDRLPPDLVGRERDRIGLGNPVVIVRIDDSRVVTDPGTHDDARVLVSQARRARSQTFCRQFSGRQPHFYWLNRFLGRGSTLRPRFAPGSISRHLG